ncbi:MAG TPA: hypothetical protein VFG63_03890 [Nocardioidaceae bacterium]|nr:hypothetical protein [Nocardioidaceae bacterium]
MRTAYRVLAYLIALEVVIQASMIAFAVAGLGIWVDEGGVFDSAAIESLEEGDLSFTGAVGMMIHGMNGMMIIPALALIFFIFSFFAKVPGGVKWAAFVLLAVVIQVGLGIFGHENAFFGLLHGVNALILLGLAMTAGARVGRARSVASTHAASSEPELV